MGSELRRCRGTKDFLCFICGEFYGTDGLLLSEGVRGLLVFIPPSNTLIRED